MNGSGLERVSTYFHPKPRGPNSQIDVQDRLLVSTMAVHQQTTDPALPLFLGLPLEIKRNIFSYLEIDSPISLKLLRLTHSVLCNSLPEVSFDSATQTLAIRSAHGVHPYILPAGTHLCFHCRYFPHWYRHNPSIIGNGSLLRETGVPRVLRRRVSLAVTRSSLSFFHERHPPLVSLAALRRTKGHSSSLTNSISTSKS